MNDPTNSRYRYLNFRNDDSYRRFVQDEKKIQNTVPTHYHNDVPAHGTYGALLFRPEWKSRRLEIMLRDGNCCVNCKSDETLQVHHRQYHFVVKENQFKLPWDYPDHLLITLCEACHKRGHSKFSVPTVNI